MSERLPCFKAYDIRGPVPEQLNAELAYCIGQAYAEEIGPRVVVVGHDMRLTSEEISDAVANGLQSRGVDVVDIGLCGTEQVYHATALLEERRVDGGIMITASHNPKGDNGMKLVAKGSVPISGDSGLFAIEARARRGPIEAKASKGGRTEADTTEPYVEDLLKYVDVDNVADLSIVANAGNGCAGPALDLFAEKLPLKFHRIQHEPDGNFPNGVPNPLLEKNRGVTIEAVREHGADLGLAWDGDFDRCFFFDDNGDFVDGYYIVGLFAEEMLRREEGASIIFDPRACWNTLDVIKRMGGRPVMSKTGHAFIKERMRQEDAIYGGEMSAHHYFRDFAYCDSGMIPWLLLVQMMSAKNQKLSQMWAEPRERFPASGEINRRLADADVAIAAVRQRYMADALSVDETDGLSIDYPTWRFNLRKSNTEPVLRLNVESRGDRPLMEKMRDELLNVIESA